MPWPGRDSIVSSPPTSSARSRMPPIPRPRSDSSKAKPRPSSATSSSTPPSASRRSRTSIRLGAAVAGGVGERLLGDPVDDQLGVVAEVGEVALDLELGVDLAPARAARPGRRSPPPGRGRRARSGAAGGRGRAARASPGWRALWSRRARASSSGGAASRAASSRSSSPVSDWLTSSWRSRATRARSSSWACSAAEPARRRSASSRRIIRRKASSIRSTSSVSPTPSIEAGEGGAGLERSTFSISSIRSSSGRSRRRSRVSASISATTTSASPITKRVMSQA